MKRFIRSKLLKFTIAGLIIGLFFFGGSLLYSQNFTLEGFIDAFTLSAILVFALGWFLYISNEGLLDILIYGTQSFAKAIIGKRMKESYYDYSAGKERLTKESYFGFWLASLVYLIGFAILYIIYI